MPSEERSPSTSSRRGLDWINLLSADIQSGVGPYLTIFLTAQGWSAGWMGTALAASAGAAAICQLPAGWLVDHTRHKRALVIGSGILIGMACLVTAFWPTFMPVILAQGALGAASSVLAPSIAAITLGLVGPRAMAGRTSRNEMLNHTGSVLTAIVAGVCGQKLGLRWIFYMTCVAAVGSALASSAIRPQEIDHDMASGGEAGERRLPMGQLLTRPAILMFLGAVLLFQCGNGAMLSLASRQLAVTHPGTETWLLTACILGAQTAMALVAWAVGRALAQGWGRKAVLIVALLAVPLRGVLFAWATDGEINAATIMGIQTLDGLATGALSVVSTVMAADLTRGTGRFNITLACVALTIAGGSALSNLIGGATMQTFGAPVAFLALSAIAILGLFFALGMPETRPDDGDQDSMDSARQAA
ncbi:major facilitator superfamily transporter [Neoasaia chiangmaiensis NBRC 101099]|uniref:Uncharacterized protein n=1 Tax=Neoasaia chiangmaiensis TaxID=320497 RepID=A0A1U9KP17_9PROT|nr:MFS transporter [Neoasaia chiangmaiensis]AQS87479.1 hypothetical protein A0U93_05485 [Neoasaia chiangmaiensis]GBR42554.1 major facilitator superfamily transporter [Neoasaia chiangmaiensis NBRC 101099]GEN16272.1 MFS transporter [Neoasaia chiangmaiensis]